MTKTSFIAVDGGGSGSRAVLRCPGAPDRTARAGPANASSDPELAAENVVALVHDLLGPDPIEIPPVTAGIAGCRLPEITEYLARLLPFPAALHDDSETTTRGALGPRDGTVLSLGTGSFACRVSEGRMRSVGGWGLTLGDEASGAWFGREALAATLRAGDGLQPQDLLTEALRDPHPLLRGNAAGPADFAKIAPLILEHRQTATARALIERAATAIDAMLKALGTRPAEPLVVTGGFGTALLPHLPDAIRSRAEAAIGSALDGAIAMAEAARR